LRSNSGSLWIKFHIRLLYFISSTFTRPRT